MFQKRIGSAPPMRKGGRQLSFEAPFFQIAGLCPRLTATAARHPFMAFGESNEVWGQPYATAGRRCARAGMPMGKPDMMGTNLTR